MQQASLLWFDPGLLRDLTEPLDPVGVPSCELPRGCSASGSDPTICNLSRTSGMFSVAADRGVEEWRRSRGACPAGPMMLRHAGMS